MNKFIQVFVHSVLVICLTGCDVLNIMRMRYANESAIPNWQNTQNHVQIKTDYISDKPYVKAIVNGKTELKFLIDTGASFTVLKDSQKVKALGLTPGFELRAGGWGDGQASSAFQTELESIDLGGIRFDNFKVAFLPTSKSQYFLSEDEVVYDGVIGHDILRHFSWTFNRQTGETQVSNQAYEIADHHSVLPIEIFLSKLYIPLTIDFGRNQIHEHDVIIDTGSRHYLKLSSSFIPEHDITTNTKITAADFGLSGLAEHQRIAVDEVKIGNNVFGKTKVNLINSDEDDPDDWWVIGNALLSKQTYTVDYFSNKLILDKPYDASKTSRFNLLGLELRKTRQGSFIVRYVFPNLPASNQPIKVGDRISSINGKSATDLTEEDWLDITNTLGTHQICLAESRNRCFQLDAVPIQGYSH